MRPHTVSDSAASFTSLRQAPRCQWYSGVRLSGVWLRGVKNSNFRYEYFREIKAILEKNLICQSDGHILYVCYCRLAKKFVRYKFCYTVHLIFWVLVFSVSSQRIWVLDSPILRYLILVNRNFPSPPSVTSASILFWGPGLSPFRSYHIGTTDQIGPYHILDSLFIVDDIRNRWPLQFRKFLPKLCAVSL